MMKIEGKWRKERKEKTGSHKIAAKARHDDDSTIKPEFLTISSTSPWPIAFHIRIRFWLTIRITHIYIIAHVSGKAYPRISHVSLCRWLHHLRRRNSGCTRLSQIACTRYTYGEKYQMHINYLNKLMLHGILDSIDKHRQTSINFFSGFLFLTMRILFY